MTASTTGPTREQRRVFGLIDEYGAKDTIIKSADTPYFPLPLNPQFDVRLMRLDNRTGTFTVDLRSSVDTWLGKHRHRGGVVATTLEGAWNYAEYDWIARPGDYVHEFPGVSHTLHYYPGTAVRFEVAGSLEFLNDDETIARIVDGFDVLDMYKEWCTANNYPFNEAVLF